MACWSSENATKAYLQALKMGKRGKEPDVDEFISALAAGNNTQFMVMACSRFVVSTTLSLVAAAHQTGGRVVCILSGNDNIPASKNVLGPYANCIEFVSGDAENQMRNYKGADFVLIDCNINGHKNVFRAAKESAKQGSERLIVGYNALHKGSWSELESYFLPIGEGLLVTGVRGNGNVDCECGGRKKSRWIITVDKCTGEKHVFRITSFPRKEVEA